MLLFAPLASRTFRGVNGEDDLLRVRLISLGWRSRADGARLVGGVVLVGYTALAPGKALVSVGTPRVRSRRPPGLALFGRPLGSERDTQTHTWRGIGVLLQD